jgi:cytochrome c biogenesis protein CcmG/thiol:disulfide interchange protein DsbE
VTTKRPPVKRPPAPPKRRKPPGRGGRGGGMMFPLLIAALVVIGVGAVIWAISASNSKSDKSANSNIPKAKIERSSSVTSTGTALAPLPTSGKDPAVGKTVPTVTGKNFAGKTATIAPNGKPMVIATIAHWCPHCQAEVPRIMDLRTTKKWPGNVGLAALITATDETLVNYPPSAWLKREGWNASVVLDDAQGQQSVGKGEEAYGVTGFPFLVWTNAEGKVVLRTAGEIPESQLQSMLDQLSKGQTPTNPAAGASSAAG